MIARGKGTKISKLESLAWEKNVPVRFQQCAWVDRPTMVEIAKHFVLKPKQLQPKQVKPNQPQPKQLKPNQRQPKQQKTTLGEARDTVGWCMEFGQRPITTGNAVCRR